MPALPLDLFRRLYGERHREVASSLDNLGAVCRHQGDLSSARKHHEQALEFTVPRFADVTEAMYDDLLRGQRRADGHSV